MRVEPRVPFEGLGAEGREGGEAGRKEKECGRGENQYH